MAYRVSIDTGGTFTDVVVTDANKQMTLGKALTTHGRVFEGIEAALSVAAEQLKLELHALLADTELLIYGTTRATNAIVEGKVAKTAFLTTAGFPDILVYKEGGKSRPHDFSRDYPGPFIPRRYTFEVAERINADGNVEVALNTSQTAALCEKLRADGFEAVAVCLLWSIRNPAHELAVGELLQQHLPGIPFTLSHQLLPVIREYRRASATAIDASLKPLMQAHLQQMRRDLEHNGLQGKLLVSTSMGGCLGVEELIERPIHTTKSGPAMAPVAARTYGALENFHGDIVVCDTGGTTFDLGLVRSGEIVFTRETWIGEQWSGHLVATSAVDVRSIGAGGGSIAWIDGGGLLRVGPQSAGSEPGPACYGRGGTEATVTDAALVLGYLDSRNFMGGRMQLDGDAARAAVARVGEVLGMSVERSAWSILRIANELMIKAIQEICMTEGVNPREAMLVAGGGAAGLNVLPIAADLGVESLLLPRTAGALSACGMQFSDIVRDASLTHVTSSDQFDVTGVATCITGLRQELNTFIASMRGEALAEARIDFSVEARYQGQVWELDTPLTCPDLQGQDQVQALVDAFHSVHERILGVRDPASPVEFLVWKGKATIAVEGNRLESDACATPYRPQPDRVRPAYFQNGWLDTGIYQGPSLRPGATITGPAIVEEPTTTIVVYPGHTLELSSQGNYIDRLQGAESP